MSISFTQAQIKRAVKGARQVDPLAVIEITATAIRILPAETVDSQSQKSEGETPEEW